VTRAFYPRCYQGLLALLVLLLASARTTLASPSLAYSFTAAKAGIYRIKNPFDWAPAEAVVRTSDLNYQPFYDAQAHTFYVYAPAPGTYQLRRGDATPLALQVPTQLTTSSRNFYEYSLPNSSISGNWFHHIIEEDSTYRETLTVPQPLARHKRASLTLCFYNFSNDPVPLTVTVNGETTDYQLPGAQEQDISVLCPGPGPGVKLAVYSAVGRVGLIKHVVSNLDAKVSEELDFSNYTYSTEHLVPGATPGPRVRELLMLRRAAATELPLRRVHNVAPAPPGMYLIITEQRFLDTSPALITALKDLSPGLDFRVVEAQDLYDTYAHSSKSAAAIKQYLQASRPAYVLLLGDANTNSEAPNDLVPSFQYLENEHSTSIASDYPYCYVDDVSQPQFALGRLPFVAVPELTAYLAKLRTFVAHHYADYLVQDDLHLLTRQATRQPTKRVAYLTPRSQWWAHFFAPTLVSALGNHHYGTVGFIGHGAFSSWSDQQKIDITAFDRLGKGTVFTLLDLSCWTGEFAHRSKDGFSEKLLKLADKGPVSIISSSGYTRISSYPHIAGFFVEASPSLTLGNCLLQAKHTLFERNEMTVDDLHAMNLLGIPNLPRY
jgi:hypothetical protein